MERSGVENMQQAMGETSSSYGEKLELMHAVIITH